jgi:hypothetical protein
MNGTEKESEVNVVIEQLELGSTGMGFGGKPQGADPPPLPISTVKVGRNQLNERAM